MIPSVFTHSGNLLGNFPAMQINITVIQVSPHFICFIVLLQALKVLRTAEFLPYVVFIEAPNFEVLKDMNRSAIEAGVVTKQMTVISEKD